MISESILKHKILLSWSDNLHDMVYLFLNEKKPVPHLPVDIKRSSDMLIQRQGEHIDRLYLDSFQV